MKKFLQMALVMVVSLGFASNVHAATEQEVINYASSTFDIAGKQVKIADVYVNQLKQYFAEKEVSAAGCDQIIADMKAVLKVMQQNSKTDPTKLNTANRKTVFNYGKDAASVLGISISYDNKGNLLLVDAMTGQSLPSVYLPTALVDVKTGTPASGAKRVLPSTGSDYTVYVAVSGLALVAIAMAGYRKLKGNA